MGDNTPPSDEVLHSCVQAYMDSGGNKSEAARRLKMNRVTFIDRLALAEKRFGVKMGKVVDGRLDYAAARQMPRPKKGTVARYILTSAQNNTHAHVEGLRNLKAYRDFLASGKNTCQIFVGTFSYAMDAYGAKAVKRGKFDAARVHDKLWYAPELREFFVDESVQLAPGLVWCGEMNILPTATNPLTGLDTYNGRNSNIVPHVRFAMESIASLPDEATKFNYTTGAITLRNYIQKRAGIIAERAHCYGALLVEVDDETNWYVRQLQIGEDGEIYDIGPAGCRGVKIANGKVEAVPVTSKRDGFVEAITWGDIHAAEMDATVRDVCWSEDGMLDQLRPKLQFFHDVFSMRSRSHHEIKNFHRTFQKMVLGEGLVEDEIQVTADFLREASREWCDGVVVRSNHDRHLDRWLNEANPTHDPLNARYFMELQGVTLRAYEQGDVSFNVLEYALRTAQGGLPQGLRFLAEDESFVICKSSAGGIECGLHGDLGPNGSRGTTRSLTKLGRPANKAHDHTATIRWPVFSAGACSLDFPYMKGPHAHSVSHIVTFANGARQIATLWNGKFRA
jgi:hypothetical protein